jgi:mRNA-degrading endonuclease toxin of MazEF toxin-antitoxin module
LVFQNPSLRTGDSVIVIPFTTVRNPSIEARIQVAPTAANGLGRDCFLEVDKLSAIRADWIGARVGCLDQETLNAAIRLSRELLSPGE